eukprot:1229599-Rhodomonas_salina.1
MSLYASATSYPHTLSQYRTPTLSQYRTLQSQRYAHPGATGAHPEGYDSTGQYVFSGRGIGQRLGQ